MKPMSSSPLTSPDVWNELHQSYEQTLVPRFSLVARRGLEMLALNPEAEVLDVACGPGTVTLLMAPLVRRVFAVDFAVSMLEVLEQKRRSLGFTNIEAQTADGTALPFPAERFDAAVSGFGLFMFADREAGFRELFRVVKPGGKIMISSWAPADGPVEAMYRIVREILPNLPFQKGQAPLGTPSEIVQEMSAAGFGAISVEGVQVSYDAESAEAFWAENSRASAPLVATRRRVSDAEWPAVEARILDALRATLPGRVEFSRTAWVAVGSKS